MPSQALLVDPLLDSVPVHEDYKVLGGVVLYQKLGQGGMAAVYRGRHLRLDIDVAVKIMAAPPGLPPEQTDDFIKRFIREAKVAASINHPGLIRVIDVNTEGGVYFLVMDYVDGESARERLERKGEFSEEEVVEICLGAAEGLAAAHRKGIVHRDVKPDNIMIDKEGGVRVTDLGLAKVYSGGEVGGPGDPSTLTQTQTAMGTPFYMAPEQFSSARSVGPAADTWSLGVTLFQLLTGELPWTDTSVFDLADKVRSEPPPNPKVICPSLSDGVCAIIQKGLEKESEERFADCGEMARKLQAHLDVIGGSPGALLADPQAGATRSPLLSVTPPASRTLTLISASALGEAEMPPPGERARAREPLAVRERRHRWVAPALVGLFVILAAGGVGGYLVLGDHRSQVTEAERATAYEKWMNEGLRLKLAGQLSEAARAYDEAGRHAPADSTEAVESAGQCRLDLHLGKAEEAERSGDFAAALLEYGKAIAAKPDHAHALFMRGSFYANRSDHARAMVDYNRAIELEPDSAEAYFGRGLSYANTDDCDRAIQDFSQAIRLMPDFAAAYASRGDMRTIQGDLDGAVRDLHKAIELDPTEPRSYVMCGTATADTGNLDGAMRYYDRAVQIDPNFAHAYFMRGHAKAANTDLDGAISDYNRAIQLDPKNALTYLARGGVRIAKGDMDGGMVDFDEAIWLDPDYVDAYVARASMKALRKRDWEGAIRDYDSAIQLDPRNAGNYVARAYARTEEGDIEGAISDYDRAIELNPNDAGVYASRAAVKRIGGDLDGSIRDCNRAIKMDPSHAAAYDTRARARAAKGDKRGAEQDLKTARDIRYPGSEPGERPLDTH